MKNEISANKTCETQRRKDGKTKNKKSQQNKSKITNTQKL